MHICWHWTPETCFGSHIWYRRLKHMSNLQVRSASNGRTRSHMTRAQAAPAFSSSVTGVSLQRNINVTKERQLRTQINPTEFTFQPGHVSYRQWWYLWQLWARRRALPLLTSRRRSCLQLQCRWRHQVPGDNTVKTEKRWLNSSSWRVSSFKSSAAAPSWERSAMPE